MNKKYALHTIENLLNQSAVLFQTGKLDDAIQLINSASLLFKIYDDESMDFDSQLDVMHLLVDDIVEVSTARFKEDLCRKFNL